MEPYYLDSAVCLSYTRLPHEPRELNILGDSLTTHIIFLPLDTLDTEFLLQNLKPTLLKVL